VKIVVCIKQVPDSAHVTVHPVTNTIMRQGIPAIINPYDLFALEEALRLKDRFGGTITVISMGPGQAAAALRKALSFGVDEAILITDKIFGGADTLATSHTLACAIRKIEQEGQVDIVFTGKQTIDGDTAQVGPGVATRLHYQLLTYVSKIRSVDPERREIVVERRAEGGAQVLQTRLPCLITMLEATNEMRYPTMPDMFRSARQEVKEWDRKALTVEDVKKFGLKGSPTIVTRVFGPPPRSTKAEMIATENRAPEEVAADLLDKLLGRYPALAADAMRRTS
jgi:electron transfer flavoprotein beta subunit